MAIKWIVTDMDGTLLDGEDKISREALAYLIACQKKGVGVLCGPFYNSMRKIYDKM